MEKKPLELYIHIPFCIKKCGYCDFLSMPADEDTRRHYVNVLLQEIWQKSKALPDYEVISLFFGGGTPSILPGGQIAKIMETVGQTFSLIPNAEITIECNPPEHRPSIHP